MQHHFFLQRAGYDQVDRVLLDRSQNCRGWVALLIMNGRIFRQGQPVQGSGKFRARIVAFIADINQAKLGIEPIANAFCLGQNLLEPRRKSAGNGDAAIRFRIEH